MKKIKVLLLIILVVLLSACGIKKEAIDEEEFNRIMTKEGFRISNVYQQVVGYGYFDDAYIAVEKDGKYQIEYYELDEDSNALNFYNANKKIFEASKTDNSIYTNVDLPDNSKYTLTTKDSYKVISRIEDTVVYLDVDKKYKNEVNNILKKLGY